jgi:hypothetical protein
MSKQNGAICAGVRVPLKSGWVTVMDAEFNAGFRDSNAGVAGPLAGFPCKQSKECSLGNSCPKKRSHFGIPAKRYTRTPYYKNGDCTLLNQPKTC